MLKMMFAAAAALSLCACVTPLTPAEQEPVVSYSVPGRVLVAVIDDRIRTRQGSEQELLGYARSMGIPNHWTVETLMMGEANAADKDKTMAQLLRARTIAGLNTGGARAQEIVLSAPASDAEASAILQRERADRLLTLLVQDWHFDVNVNWVGAFRFDSDTEVIVQNNAGTLLRERFAESQAIQGEGDKSWGNMILAAYRAKLGEMLNDPDVRNALTTTTPVAVAVGVAQPFATALEAPAPPAPSPVP